MDEQVVCVEAAILDDRWQFPCTNGQAERQLDVITHQEQRRQAGIERHAGAPMRVRMEPAAAGAIADGELVDAARTRRDREAQMALHFLWHMQAVPVHDSLFGQRVTGTMRMRWQSRSTCCVERHSCVVLRIAICCGNDLQRRWLVRTEAVRVAPAHRSLGQPLAIRR